MDNFNNHSPSQQSHWNPESRAARGNSSSATAIPMKLADKAADMKERVAGIGRKAVDKLDDSRETAAGALDATASTLHTRGDQISVATHSAANKIHSTANYVRNTDVKGMVDDIENILKRYPAQTLAAAAFFGFLVGRAFRRFD